MPALKARVRELEELFDEASIGLLWTTRAGRVLQANRALLDILECRTEDCLGHAWAEFHSDRAALADLIGQVSHRETLRNHPATLRARGGRLKEVLVDASALWQGGKIVHIRWFIRDITRRKQLEREVLATSERERLGFRAGIARQPGATTEWHHLSGRSAARAAFGNWRCRRRQLERIARLLRRAMEETRRVSRGLSPVRPEPEGLGDALRELVAHTQNLFGIVCHLRNPKPGYCPMAKGPPIFTGLPRKR